MVESEKMQCFYIEIAKYDLLNNLKEVYKKNIKISPYDSIKSDFTLSSSRSDLKYNAPAHFEMLNELKNKIYWTNMILKKEKVIKEYTDYNNHLNVAYYVRIFDIAADVMLDNFNMGGTSAKKDKKTTFVAEMSTSYKQEVKLGEEVETHITFVDHDKKRIQYKLSMFHKEKKYLAATNEVLFLYVDLAQRKVVEFDSDRIKLMDNFIKENSSKFSNENLVFSKKLKK